MDAEDGFGVTSVSPQWFGISSRPETATIPATRSIQCDLDRPEFDSPHSQPLSHIGTGEQEASKHNGFVALREAYPTRTILSN